jgi:hypothetical protein
MIEISTQILLECFRDVSVRVDKYYGKDLYLEAARLATKQPELTLTPEARQKVKLALHSAVYGAQNPVIFITKGEQINEST